MSISAAELARQLGVTVAGDGDVNLQGVSSLTSAKAGTLTFLAGDRYRQYLENTLASAVVLKPEYVDNCPVTALVADDPYLTYAKAAQLLYPQPTGEGYVHPAAIIGEGCSIHESVSIAAGVVIEDGVKIDAGARIGPGSVIGSETEIGAYTLLEANISCMHNVSIGRRCIIHSGAVIGCDGFGFANDSGQWIKIPQVGSVRIGDDVDIGANTTIDRGAIDDTIIGDGVKLDNQIQIAHNVQIGDHTAIAACTGIAGSTTIGRHCAIGGGVGIVGHITITDHVTITATSFVTGSIKKSGSYSSGVPLQETRSWRRNYIRFRQLDDMAKILNKQDN